MLWLLSQWKMCARIKKKKKTRNVNTQQYGNGSANAWSRNNNNNNHNEKRTTNSFVSSPDVMAFFSHLLYFLSAHLPFACSLHLRVCVFIASLFDFSFYTSAICLLSSSSFASPFYDRITVSSYVNIHLILSQSPF